MNFSVVTLEIAVAILGIVLLATGLLLTSSMKKVNGLIAAVVLTVLLVYSFASSGAAKGEFFMGMYSTDSMTLYFKQLFMIAAIFVTIMSLTSTTRFKENGGEFYSIMIFALLGMMVMVSANDFITLYVGLELMTISFVILTGFDKSSQKSAEAGIKYVLLSAMSSAVLLYGLSLFYGLSGTTDFGGFAKYAQSGIVSPMFVVAVIMLLAGLGFKISAVPFHMWSPDIYEGAPTPITAFLATGSKVAAFAVLIRMLTLMLKDNYAMFVGILIMLAVLTMIVGNLIAIPQKNIKRMLAYSSISHAGYILLGLVAFTDLGISAMLYYIFIYIFATLGAFSSVVALADSTGSDEIESFRGMWKRSPFITAVLMISLLSMAGIPPAAGFIGKFYLFASIVNQGYVWLALLAIGMSVVSVYYYIMVIRVMLAPAPENAVKVSVAMSHKLVMATAAAVTVFLGIYAAPLTNWTNNVMAAFL